MDGRAPETSIVCLGEALVDLIRTPVAADGRERFSAHFGGALANVAVAVARAGAPAALAGGAGDDEFGRLLRDRLAAEGVGLAHHRVLPGLRTPFAFVRLDGTGEPAFDIHGAGIEAGLAPLAGREQDLVAGAAAIVVGSNTLAAEPGRAVTLAAVAAARERGVPILFDPNIRPGRWDRLGEALALCRSIIAASFVCKTNLTEARQILGDPRLGAAEAAERVAALGARLAIVTDGPRGAVGRGAASAESAADPVTDANPIGAGDAFMGALAAALWAADWESDGLAAALEAAVVAAAGTCRTVGAID